MRTFLYCEVGRCVRVLDPCLSKQEARRQRLDWKITDLEVEDYCFDDEAVILRWKRSKDCHHLQELGCEFGKDGAWAIALDLLLSFD